MAESLCNEFVHLSCDYSKPEVLLQLVKTCPYGEQLRFLELLQGHLHKDFISHLPEPLVRKVLSYLPVADAIKCTQVSKNWNKVIGACSSFWLDRARELGLSSSFIKDHSSKDLKELCCSAMGHRDYIRALTPHMMVIAKSPGSGYANTSYIYAGNSIALRYKELNGQAQVLVERVIFPHTLVEVASFTVQSFSGRIKWAASSGNYVLWKQVDGKWNGCDTTSLNSELDQWVDEPVSQGFHSITFCRQCHLLAILSEAEDDVEVWDLQIVKLEAGRSTVCKMVYPLPLERVQSCWAKKRHFLGGDVTLLSETEEKDVNGFCQSHQVLLQMDAKLVLHRLKSVPLTERLLVVHHLLPDAKLSKPLHVFTPRASEEPLDMLDLQVSKGRPAFCYSQDYSRVALLHECYLYVWLVADQKEETCVDLIHHNLPTDCKCVALGSVYAVLASNSHGTCYVVVIGTGEVLFQTASSEHFNPDAQRSIRFNFFPPINQDWLSSFKYSDFWPLALVFDYFNSVEDPSVEHELKSLLGTRSRVTSDWGLSIR